VKHKSAGVEYVPQSRLGWLDLDDEASRRIGEALKALDEPGTLDPIGLGSVRDAFADALAPGTSTIQTRLRYFLFIPWICQRIEKSDTTPTQFAKRLKDDEATLINCLRHLGPGEGVQGYSVGENLKRMPSSAYWGGLRSWRIRTHKASISEYSRLLPDIRRQVMVDGSDGTVGAVANSIWAALPAPPANFLEEDINFDLTQEESGTLIDRIRQSHPKSLLAAACAEPENSSSAESAWELDGRVINSIVGLREVVDNARCISEATHGAQLLYNLLVARRAKSELGMETDTAIQERLAELANWSILIQERASVLVPWANDLNNFWALQPLAGRVPEPARRFITEITKIAVNNPDGLANDAKAEDLIVRREISIKKTRARLGGRAGLMNWDGQSFGGQLNFRWPTAKSYLSDLATSLSSAS